MDGIMCITSMSDQVVILGVIFNGLIFSIFHILILEHFHVRSYFMVIMFTVGCSTAEYFCVLLFYVHKVILTPVVVRAAVVTRGLQQGEGRAGTPGSSHHTHDLRKVCVRACVRRKCICAQETICNTICSRILK